MGGTIQNGQKIQTESIQTRIPSLLRWTTRCSGLPPIRPSNPEEETLETLRFQDPFVEVIIHDHDDDDDDDRVGDDDDEEKDADADVEERILVPTNALYDPTRTAIISFDFFKDNLGDARQRFPHCLQARLWNTTSRFPGP